ncbi:hypothetical protein SDC9_203182 [bioreactor metagenome]|uniref:Uncharacterized protein n=1 Tax=bioreactor metagenome TaxID=1076179 RepID=A0A645IYH6_9ZZZZ
MKHSAAVGDRTADREITAVRGDEAFEDLPAADGPRPDPFRRRTVNQFGKRVTRLKQHRLDHQAVVEIEGERRPVLIKSVARIPLFELAESVIDPQAVVFPGQPFQRGFDRDRKQQPVVVAGANPPGQPEHAD